MSGYSPKEATGWAWSASSATARVLKSCRVEPSLKTAAPGSRFQFERMGCFCSDTVDGKPGAPVFNRTVTLRDTWAKLQKKS